MGKRRDVLTRLKTALDGLVLDNGDVLAATNTLFDPFGIDTKILPRISITPEPHNVQVNLGGVQYDSTYRVSILGYNYSRKGEELILATEDIIEKIIAALTLQSNVDTFKGVNCNGFSITDMGPILNEVFDDPPNLAFFSVPVGVVFIDN